MTDTEYTPDTGTIKVCYGYAQAEGLGRTIKESQVEFDRWLAQHDAEVTAQAEARIIKLLEETQDDWRCREGCCACFGWNDNTPINQLGLLIALIKGSQKDNETVALLTEGEE